MLGLKMDQEVLGELVKTKAPAVGQLMDQYPGIWTLVASRWFICLYIDILPIEVRKRFNSAGQNERSSSPHRPASCSFRQFCGSGTASSTRVPRFSSGWLWLSSSITRWRSCERAHCLMCASASSRSPVELSPWTATPSRRWDERRREAGEELSKPFPSLTMTQEDN